MKVKRALVGCLILFSCMACLVSGLVSCRADPSPVLTPEEQARQLGEQALAQTLSRLDAAATLMGQGRVKDAINAYLPALQTEPDFAALSAQSAALSARAETLQGQIFDSQKQAMDLNTPGSDDLVTQKIAVEGQIQTIQKLLQLEPTFAEAHANLAHLLLQSGAASACLMQYQQAIRLNSLLAAVLRPAILHAHLVEADRLAKLGRPEAQAEYREALRLDPGNASAHAGLGTALLTQGKPADAVPELTEAIRLDPANSQANLTLGVALYQSGQVEQARSLWRTLAKSGDAQTAEQAHGMLDRYLPPAAPVPVPKDPNEAAIQLGREQVHDFPDESFSHNNLAFALHHAKQDDEALHEVKTALSLDPDSVDAHNNLGRILSESEHDDAAEEEYKQALKLDSDNGPVHNNLGAVYFDRQQWKQAEYEFRKALEGDHSDPYAHHNLAETLLEEGRLAESCRECDKTLQYDPTFSPAYATRGLVEDNLGRQSRGLLDIQQAVKMATDPVQQILDLADPLSQFAGRALAAQQFGLILKLYPPTAEGEQAWGRLLLANGQDQAAAAEFGDAVRLNPKLVSAHLLLARTLLRLNRLDAAASEARAALALEPRSAEARNTLGLALYQAGQTEQGREQWKQALTLDDKDAVRNAAGFLQEFP